MPIFIPRPGVALLIESAPRPGESTKHLHVLMTGARTTSQGQQKLAIVSISTVRNTPSTEVTCILEPGDHAFIRHSSFIYYARARIVTIEQTQHGIDSGAIRLLETFEDHVFQRILDGVHSSPRIPQQVRDFILGSGERGGT